MHKTLKAEATRAPRADRQAQQRRFDTFRTEFNEERPHEALAQATPASCYTASPRAYPTRLAPLEYAAHCEVRRVSRNGGIRWHNHWVNVRHVLGDEYIALEEIDDALWQVSFGPVALDASTRRCSGSKTSMATSRARGGAPPPTSECVTDVLRLLRYRCP